MFQEQSNEGQMFKQGVKKMSAKIERSPSSCTETNGPAQQEIDTLFSYYESEDWSAAEHLANALIQSFPNHPFGWKVLGAIFKITGRAEDSLRAMLESVRLEPYDAEAHANLGAVFKDLGRLTEAEMSCQQAILLDSKCASAFNNLGNSLIDQGRMKEAESALRKALELKPDFSEANYNLGNVLNATGRIFNAELAYHEAIRLKPDYYEAHNNRSIVLKDLGRYADAEASCRQAICLNPDYVEAHSNLLFNLNYMESLSIEATLFEAKRFGSMVSDRSLPKYTTWDIELNSPKLRIGFVSGDLNRHPVGYFIEGLIKGLDHGQFELIAFPTNSKLDDQTNRIESHFQKWIPIFGKGDFEAATLIREQGIQILVDLSGHTAHNRLPVFSYKPAPVQVSWLGYFATTGLPEMDFFLGDPIMSPHSEQHHFTEKIWQLAETWLCLSPPTQALPVFSLPALTNGYVTFGCFGNLSKMNHQVVKTWASILRKVTSAKLFIKSNQLSDPHVIDEVKHRFSSNGISANRLILEGHSPREEYFQAYNKIDIVLDTFPYPGGTTSVDALWMGVSVLTLKGDRFLSRLGESIATNAGQTNWIAEDVSDYVNKATEFASDIQTIVNLRASLREHVLKTPLFDSRRFAKSFGDALQEMWNKGVGNIRTHNSNH